MTDNNDDVAGLEAEQVDDVVPLERALPEEDEKAGKYLSNWQRCQADFANYKKHAEQEKKEIVEFANSALICSLLPVLDDLERAFSSIPDEYCESNWTEGMRLIYNKLKSTLNAQGLVEIEATGECFDPRIHEAVMQQDGAEGIVIEEKQKGYKFKDRVVRPCMVTVGKGEEGKAIKRTIRKEKHKWEEQ